MIELRVSELHLGYAGTPILKGVSMTLNKGEIVALLGPSGSGKTTLLRALAGLETPNQGRISIGDRVVYDALAHSNVPAEARNLGLVFQSYALWPHMTVLKNIGYSLKLRKVSVDEINARVHAVLKQLGLAQLGERYPHQLSGGQQQRVAIGRALVYNPPVILLDEPLSNLDAKLREEARIFLRELIGELNLSAIMVTHDQNEAMAIADRILLLNNGKIEQEGTPQTMYSAPITLFAAEFMGSNNILKGKITQLCDGYARISGEHWTLWGKMLGDFTLGQVGTAVIRVEEVNIDPLAIENYFELPLNTSMYLGGHWEHLFKVEGTTVDFPTLRVHGRTVLQAAQHYRLFMPKDKVWVFS